jgi:hypothetical protein
MSAPPIPKSILIHIAAGLLAALLLGALFFAPAQAAITYPVDREATREQWALVQKVDGVWTVFRRDADWPDAEGRPVPVPPDYAWVHQERVDPPEIDSRLQDIIYPCPEVIDVVAETVTTTCTAVLRPQAELVSAIENAAQDRISEALDVLGLRDPSDLWRVVALLTAERAGQVLTADQSSWLDDVGEAARAYVDAVRARQSAIEAWVIAHPGQVPAIGPDEWPPLPSLP